MIKRRTQARRLGSRPASYTYYLVTVGVSLIFYSSALSHLLSDDNNNFNFTGPLFDLNERKGPGT